MFDPFFCALLGFILCEFPENPKKTWTFIVDLKLYDTEKLQNGISENEPLYQVE